MSRHGPAGSVARALRRRARRAAPRSPARPRVALAALAGARRRGASRIARTRRRLAPAERAAASTPARYGDRVAARCAQLRVPEDATRPEGRRSRCTSRSSRPPGSLRAERSSISRAARAALRAPPRSRSTRSSRRSASSATSCSSTSAGRAARTRSRARRSTCRATDAEAVAAYFRRCFARLGDRARLLTSTAAADDLERVRSVLGYGRVDVYGSSYGATLAQLYLRRHPRVRAHASRSTARSLAERAGVRARSAQRRARTARADRSLHRPRPRCRARLPRHA